MASVVNPPRGMRDFLPAEKRRRDALIQTISQTYQRHGFEGIETPVLEDHATLHSGLGGDNEKLSFQVLRRGLTPEDLRSAESVDALADLGLRFDLTVPLARFVASHHAELPPVFRALHIAPVWRAERPQKGRFRQFVQCDIDIVGESGSLAEREVLLATADVLGELGVSNYRFRVNDRRLLHSLLDEAGVPADAALSVLITLDKLDKIGVEGVLGELSERHGQQLNLPVIETVLRRAESSPLSWDAQEVAQLMAAPREVAQSLVDWAADLAARLGEDRVVFDPTLVRGMGYYTGSIVELEHPDLGVSLGGGGRYDGMIGRFLSTDLPAFGFSLGFERLVEVVDGAKADSADRVALVYERGVSEALLLDLKSQLVSQGRVVRLTQATRNLKALFDRLHADGVRHVADVDGSVSGLDDLSWRELG